MCRFWPASLIIGLSCCLPWETARADDAALAAALNGLFTSGWKTTATALSSAQPHYERAQAAAPQDPRPAYAMALVAIKNSKHEETRKWLREALARRKDDPGHRQRRREQVVQKRAEQHQRGPDPTGRAHGVAPDVSCCAAARENRTAGSTLRPRPRVHAARSPTAAIIAVGMRRAARSPRRCERQNAWLHRVLIE